MAVTLPGGGTGSASSVIGNSEYNESDNSEWIYTVVYSTSKSSTGANYVVNLNGLPSNTSSITISDAQVMSSIDDFNKYKELKDSSYITSSGSNNGTDINATAQEIKDHSAGSSQIAINSVTGSCASSPCAASINETFSNLDSITYHSTTNKNGDSVNVIYFPIKFKVTIKQEENGKKSVSSGNITIDYETNMIPIMYAETCPVDADKDSTNGCWVKADSTNTNATYKWYDYSNHIWANAATVTTSTLSTYQSAAVGTPVLYADTMGYFVYIPRYSYKLFNVNADGSSYSTAQEILVNFENSSTTKSTGSTNGTYLTHPAFTFGDKELNGFWIGKFETSYTSDNSSEITSATALAQGVTVKPSTSTQTMYSLRFMSVFNLYTTMSSLTNGGGQTSSNHNLSTLESTMLTNMEWGAVAYLTESVYGTCTGTKGSAVCTTQPQINSVSTYKTGCGPQSAGSTADGTTCNYYNTTIGKLASTTQNIYGVYDMNGGAWEYVMGVTYDSAGTAPYYGSSGFTAGTMPNAKYYDLYTYGTTYNDAAAYARGKLGDATKEVVASSGTTWFDSNAYFPDDNYSWLQRGGYYYYGSDPGVLAFISDSGYTSSDSSGRVCLH